MLRIASIQDQHWFFLWPTSWQRYFLESQDRECFALHPSAPEFPHGTFLLHRLCFQEVKHRSGNFKRVNCMSRNLVGSNRAKLYKFPTNCFRYVYQFTLAGYTLVTVCFLEWRIMLAWSVLAFANWASVHLKEIFVDCSFSWLVFELFCFRWRFFKRELVAWEVLNRWLFSLRTGSWRL